MNDNLVGFSERNFTLQTEALFDGDYLPILFVDSELSIVILFEHQNRTCKVAEIGELLGMSLSAKIEIVLRPRSYGDIFDILAGQRRGRRGCRHVKTPVKLLHDVAPPRAYCHSEGFH